MVKVALVVRLVAKAGKEETVRALLAGAEPLAKSRVVHARVVRAANGAERLLHRGRVRQRR